MEGRPSYGPRPSNVDDLPTSAHGLWAMAHVASQRSIRDNARHEMPCPIPGCGVDCGEFLLRSTLRLPPPIKDHGRLRFMHMARAAFASAPRALASDQAANRAVSDPMICASAWPRTDGHWRFSMYFAGFRIL
jgi:hypothetical protein